MNEPQKPNHTITDPVPSVPATSDTLSSAIDDMSGTGPQIPGEGPESLRFLSPPKASDELGRLGGYRIVGVLGEGGMGMVLEAEDERLKRHIAIKVMKKEIAMKETQRLRFLREAQAAAAVEHDFIVPILQVGEDNGVPFIVMPFLKGEPLDKRMRRGRLDISEVLLIGRQVAEGLAVAHEHGLVHRDIKPGNIWLESTNRTDQPLRVRILDFGLARLSNDNLELTNSNVVVGTPAFMAPEQASRQPVDHRADLYSFGTMLYQMSTGRLPFESKTVFELMFQLANETPPEPTTLNPDLPPALSRLIMKLMEKSPANRLPNAREAVKVLKQLQPDTVVVVVARQGPTVEANPWAGIDDSGATEAIDSRNVKPIAPTAAVPPLAASRPSEPASAPRRRPLPLMISAIIAAGLLVGAFFAFRGNKEEPKPDGTVKKDESSPKVVRNDPPKKEPSSTSTINQRVAKALPMAHFDITKDGIPIAAKAAAMLPAEPYSIRRIYFVPPAKPPAFDVFLATVSELPELKDIGDYTKTYRISAEQLDALSRAPFASQIHTLFLGFELTPENVEILKQFPKLASLGCSGRSTDDASLAALKGLPALRILNLDYLDASPNVTQKGMDALADLTLIEFTGWPPPEAKSEWMSFTNRLAGLTVLKTGRLTDGHLAEIAKCAKLQTLVIGNNRLSESGLMALKGHPSLRTLKFDGSLNALTPAGLKALSAVLPKCTIEYPGGIIRPADGSVPIIQPADPAMEPIEPPTVVKGPEVSFDLGNGVKLEVVKINAKGKSFLMGSPKDEPDRMARTKQRDFDPEEQHEVTFGNDFFMGKYEVTQEQYQAIMGANPSRSARNPKNPVDFVSWNEAQNFVTKINLKLKDQKVQFRLPSEAEWEYSCRAGTTTAYHFGNTLAAAAANCTGSSTKRVGSYQPNAFGLYDMHGNVREWCEDYFGPYSTAPKDGKAQNIQQKDDLRVLRGGGWYNVTLGPGKCRSANRGGIAPELMCDFGGFRVAATQDGEAKVDLPKKADPPPPPVIKGNEMSFDLGNGVKLDVIKINGKGKTFLMGSPKDEEGRDSSEGKFDKESPHEVTFNRDFYLGKFEVTQQQFEAVMMSNPSKFKGPAHPVETVSWNEAQDFCKKLNERFKDRKVVFRLPSEAEWEYACRAGTTTPYHCGASLDRKQANFGDTGNGSTAPVGSYPPNAFNLHDMHGNVSEWCEDYYGDYADAPRDGSATTVKKTFESRILRGGNWGSNVKSSRSASRNNAWPDYKGVNRNGFRVAVDIADDSPLLAPK